MAWNTRYRSWATPLLALGALTWLGCGGDDPVTGDPGPCPGVDVSGCAVSLAPSGGDDQKALQIALIDAQSGDEICLCPGTFTVTKELSLTVPDVTLRGLGASRDDVVLDFAEQTVGDDALTATSDGFTVEHLSVKNSPGNSIVVTGAEDVTFRDIKVSWDAGSVTANGAYAVYPVKSTRVIIEDSEVVGAADAGIYVGQCNQAIVRNNVVYGNVAGIEIENTSDAEVYGNEAYDNSAGILVFVLPNLEKKDGARAKVHDNDVRDNNRDNFAEPGTVVADVPPGTGFLLLGPDSTEIHDNSITNNDSTAVLIVSLATLAAINSSLSVDPATPGYVENVYIHGNTLSGNGTAPKGVAGFVGITPLEDVVWDGVQADPMAAANDANLCLTSSPPSFRNFAGVAGIADPTLQNTDPTPHLCDGDVLPAVSW
jgi:parallel beta-helix repeat protein